MKNAIILITTLFFSSLQAQDKDLLVTYSKGACFGKCPVYNIEITNSGLLTYEGKFNVERRGTFQRQLEKRELRKLKRKLKCGKFKNLEPEYGAEIMDAPMSVISYFKKDTIYTTKVKGTAPEKFKKIQEIADQLGDINNQAFNWETIREIESEQPKRLASQTIIVELHDGVLLEKWIKKYSKYNLALMKSLTPGKPIYLLEFDHLRIHTPQLIIQMQQDREVKNAEPNTMVKIR